MKTRLQGRENAQPGKALRGQGERAQQTQNPGTKDTSKEADRMANLARARPPDRLKVAPDGSPRTEFKKASLCKVGLDLLTR